MLQERYIDVNTQENLMGDSVIVDKDNNVHIQETLIHPFSLSPEKKFQIASQLTPVTGRGFMRTDLTSPELFQDTANHVLMCDKLIITRHNHAVSSFAAISIRTGTLNNLQGKHYKLLHLEGIITEERFQHTDLAYRLLHSELKSGGYDYIGFHTQSLKMLKLGQRLAHIDPEVSLNFARVINSRNPQGLIDVGRYGGKSLYADKDRFAAYAITDINWREGDALICVGPVHK